MLFSHRVFIASTWYKPDTIKEVMTTHTVARIDPTLPVCATSFYDTIRDQEFVDRRRQWRIKAGEERGVGFEEGMPQGLPNNLPSSCHGKLRFVKVSPQMKSGVRESPKTQ